MKLLEILYDHFEGKWPRIDKCYGIVQHDTKTCYLYDDLRWRCNTTFDYFDVEKLADDYITAVVYAEDFEDHYEKQKEKQMTKVFTEAQKIDIVGDFLNNNYDGVSKTEFARLHSTSSRSLGRWIDKYADLVIRKVPIDPARGTKENPFQIGDTVLEIKQDEPIHFTGTSQSITLYRGEESVTVHKDQKKYPKVVQVLLDGELEEAWTIGNVKETLEKFSEGSLVVNNGAVTINGFEVVNDMSNRLIDMLDDGTSQCAEGIKVFARFFENLMNVQDKRIVDELYLFLQHNDIKLNEDGSFTGYKAVTREYKDKRTNLIDNSPGNIVTMPRSLVNNDKHQTCSTGLHVGNYDYVKSFGDQWSRFVTVKVFPEDVVSVPVDYNGGKLRACKYEVLDDVTDQFID